MELKNTWNDLDIFNDSVDSDNRPSNCYCPGPYISWWETGWEWFENRRRFVSKCQNVTPHKTIERFSHLGNNHFEFLLYLLLSPAFVVVAWYYCFMFWKHRASINHQMKLIWKRKTEFRKIIKRVSFSFQKTTCCLSVTVVEWTTPLYSHCYLLYTILYQCLEWHSGANSYARRWERRSTRHFLCVYTEEIIFFLFFFFKLMVGLVHSSESRNRVHLFIFLSAFLYLYTERKKILMSFWVLFGRLFSKRDCQHSLWLVCWLCTRTTTTWNSSHANVDPSERSLFFHPGIFDLIYISSVYFL